MKTVVKDDANPCLQRAVEEGWSWEGFRENAHEDYVSIREQALKEQRCECAYTGLWLGEGTSQEVHVDHFRKKVLYPEQTFRWANLFAAAKSKDYGADYKDRSIQGPRADADRQYEEFWSPLAENLDGAFWYRQDGHIMPHPILSEEEKLLAQRTIDRFHLNADDLKRRRKGVIQNVRELRQLDDETVRGCMGTAGFSFVVEFELRNR